MALYITGDTHGEAGRFTYMDSAIMRTLTKDDYLIICVDFGYIFNNTYNERKFLRYMAEELPFTILWVDGNHDNFDLINEYPVEVWNGGKVHIVGRDKDKNAKVIHLMRGQVFELEKKKIFTFGGGYSIDKAMRTEGYSWWPEEMPNDNEMKEAIESLKRVNYKVDYIITHTAPEETMNLFYPDHVKEKPLNNFLEWVCESTEYKHWYFGHLHLEKDFSFRHQTCIWFQLRNMETNEVVE